MSAVLAPPRLSLVNGPTPLEYCEYYSKVTGREIYLWRDDLTGFLLSGNKVRKLEFLLKDAQLQGATSVITCGGAQSNHARATAFAANRLGMACHIVARQNPPGASEAKVATGNQFLMLQSGATLHPVTFGDYQAAGGYDSFLNDLKIKLEQKRGEKVYIIPEGGSNPLGLWGYIQGIAELADTPKPPWGEAGPDSLVTAVGSGGTLGGLALGVARQAWSTAVIGFNVCDSAAFFQKKVGALVDEATQTWNLMKPESKLQVIDGYVGQGYAQTTATEMDFYKEAIAKGHVTLDPVYTGKAFRGMIDQLDKSPERFGQTIVFLHTGGLFANFAFAEQWV